MEHFDPRGDLTLVVGEEQALFHVCSRALARSSPVFDVMLYGPFAEGRDQNHHRWEVTLPEDSPEGLRIVLHAVHGKPHAVPPFLAPASLLAAATMADKYDMVECLSPWWRRWIDALPSRLCDAEAFVQHLRIFELLGDQSSYEKALGEFLSCSRRDPWSGRFWLGGDHARQDLESGEDGELESRDQHEHDVLVGLDIFRKSG
jgi:hypothetical protein